MNVYSCMYEENKKKEEGGRVEKRTRKKKLTNALEKGKGLKRALRTPRFFPPISLMDFV